MFSRCALRTCYDRSALERVFKTLNCSLMDIKVYEEKINHMRFVDDLMYKRNTSNGDKWTWEDRTENKLEKKKKSRI